jgi:hypothetical protein
MAGAAAKRLWIPRLPGARSSRALCPANIKTSAGADLQAGAFDHARDLRKQEQADGPMFPEAITS